MAPPIEPRRDPVQVTFIDYSAAIAVSHTFTPVTTSYPTFLSLLSALSGSVAHRLENLPHQYVQGQGFTRAHRDPDPQAIDGHPEPDRQDRGRLDEAGTPGGRGRPDQAELGLGRA